MTESALSPRREAFLHIGTFKSGTSYLQSVLVRNQRVLADAGVCFPTGDRKWGAQVRAVRDVLGMRGIRPSDGAWQALFEEIRQRDHDKVILSMEFLSLADQPTVERIIADFEDYKVSVILGARDLARVLPSAWQSMVKQGHTWSFPDFVASVTADEPVDPDPHRRFWLHHDLESIIDRWGNTVGESNIHLLIVPPSSAPHTLLWERFCSIVRIDPNTVDSSQDQTSNFSLSFSDAELMRRVNKQLRPELNRLAFKRWATRVFANKILRTDSPSTTSGDRVRLDPATFAWAAARSQQLVDSLQARSVQIVGSLDELVPSPQIHAGPNRPSVEYPEEAIAIIARLVQRLASTDPELAASTSPRPNRRTLQLGARGYSPPENRRARSRGHEAEYDAGVTPDDLDDPFEP